jgi:hypothetical protein
VLAFSLGISPSFQKHDETRQVAKDSILKIEMHLSAFGVESDNFPSIDVAIDFVIDSGRCRKWYYNPAFKESVYNLSEAEMKQVLELLKNADLERLKTDYTVGFSDQPTSTTTIYTDKGKFRVKDYGLEGEYPLKELYKIVYKY